MSYLDRLKALKGQNAPTMPAVKTAKSPSVGFDGSEGCRIPESAGVPDGPFSEYLEERAGVYEFCARIPRPEAERRARRDAEARLQCLVEEAAIRYKAKPGELAEMVRIALASPDAAWQTLATGGAT